MFHLNNKGYLQIDFFFVMLFFILFFTLVYSAHTSYLSQYEYIQEQRYLSATAQDVCVLLTQYSGLPNTWESNVSLASTIGLQSTTSDQLQNSKVDAFFNETNYGDVVDSFDISGVLYVSLQQYSTGLEFFSIGEQASVGSQAGSARCFEMYDGDFVVLNVEVWR